MNEQRITDALRCLLLIVATGIGGACTTTEEFLRTSVDQPLCRDGTSATAIHTSIEGTGIILVIARGRLQWQCGNQRPIDGEKLVQRLKPWIKERYPIPPPEYRESMHTTFLFTLAIVSLDPVVIVAVPVPFTVHSWKTTLVDAAFTTSEVSDDGVRRRKRSVQLPYGFVGTIVVPWSSEAVWFAPDHELGPVPVDPTPNGDVLIQVGDADFVLRRDGAVWRAERVQ